jgi:5-methylcytosine-specific restriction endonuclease McrA
MTDGKRDYKKELNWEHTKAKHRAQDRVARVLARREVEKDTGNLPRSMQVDHKKPITEGGSTTARSNLRVVSAKTNLHKEAMRKKR